MKSAKVKEKSPVAKKKPGRKKGGTNRFSKENIAKARAIGRQLPLEYMLKVMNNPRADPHRRDDMARAAAPYCHNRLASITLKGDPTQPVTLVTATMTMQEAAEAYALMRDNPRAMIIDQVGNIVGEAAAQIVEQLDEEEDA